MLNMINDIINRNLKFQKKILDNSDLGKILNIRHEFSLIFPIIHQFNFIKSMDNSLYKKYNQ